MIDAAIEYLDSYSDDALDAVEDAAVTAWQSLLLRLTGSRADTVMKTPLPPPTLFLPSSGTLQFNDLGAALSLTTYAHALLAQMSLDIEKRALARLQRGELPGKSDYRTKLDIDDWPYYRWRYGYPFGWFADRFWPRFPWIDDNLRLYGCGVAPSQWTVKDYATNPSSVHLLSYASGDR
jgi:hypothetical protein